MSWTPRVEFRWQSFRRLYKTAENREENSLRKLYTRLVCTTEFSRYLRVFFTVDKHNCWAYDTVTPCVYTACSCVPVHCEIVFGRFLNENLIAFGTFTAVLFTKTVTIYKKIFEKKKTKESIKLRYRFLGNKLNENIQQCAAVVIINLKFVLSSGVYSGSRIFNIRTQLTRCENFHVPLDR